MDGEDFTKWMGEKAKLSPSPSRTTEEDHRAQGFAWRSLQATRVGDMYLSPVNDFSGCAGAAVSAGRRRAGRHLLPSWTKRSKPWVEKANGAYEYCLKFTAATGAWFKHFMTRLRGGVVSNSNLASTPRAAEWRGSDVLLQSLYSETHAGSNSRALVEMNCRKK